MTKRIVHIVLSSWLAVILLFGTTPGEFLHLFAGHQDTPCYHHDELSFEPEHHHCVFLSFTLQPFHNDACLIRIPLQEPGYPSFMQAPALQFQARSVPAGISRGPPAC